LSPTRARAAHHAGVALHHHARAPLALDVPFVVPDREHALARDLGAPDIVIAGDRDAAAALAFDAPHVASDRDAAAARDLDGAGVVSHPQVLAAQLAGAAVFMDARLRARRSRDVSVVESDPDAAPRFDLDGALIVRHRDQFPGADTDHLAGHHARHDGHLGPHNPRSDGGVRRRSEP
jgi:hypothetical protein